MSHIAPTVENYDYLANVEYHKKDYLGDSIDKFEKSAGGIKSAIIVGGKQSKSVREEYSQKVNKLIRQRFIDRNIPISLLSDLKFYECDLFYSSADDTLKIGINKDFNDVSSAFGDVELQGNDSIEINR